MKGNIKSSLLEIQSVDEEQDLIGNINELLDEDNGLDSQNQNSSQG
tara:strand:- start:766 stop:903 length:138 start_codon:yes stop_codon:yes gene_type:complete